jgi:hypothetical protein
VSLHDSRDTVVLVVVDTTVMVVLRDVDVVLDDELLLDVALLDVGDVDVVLLVVVVGLGRGFGSSRIRLVQSTSSVFCSSPVWASITRTAVRMSSTYSHV